MPLTSHARSLAAALVAALAVVWGAAGISATTQARTDRAQTSSAAAISDVVTLTVLAAPTATDDDATEPGTLPPVSVLGESTQAHAAVPSTAIAAAVSPTQHGHIANGQRGPPEH